MFCINKTEDPSAQNLNIGPKALIYWSYYKPISVQSKNSSPLVYICRQTLLHYDTLTISNVLLIQKLRKVYKLC